MKADEVAERGTASSGAVKGQQGQVEGAVKTQGQGQGQGGKKDKEGKKADAYEMAIGYTKEGDFPSWYSDVSA